MPKANFKEKSGGNAKSNSRNPSDWQNFEFVALTLDEAQKDQFREWYKEQGQRALDELPSMVTGGYKASVGWDEGSQCFIASLTCKEPTDPNYGYVLSSRSTDLWEAMALNVFKTVEICEEYEWPRTPQVRNFG